MTTETNNSKVLNKVRNLLNKNTENGASEAEAENALILAQKLMAKHNISQEEIFISKNDIDFGSVLNQRQGHEKINFQWDLLKIISNGHNCKTLKNTKFNPETYSNEIVYRVYGFPEDREIVIELFKIVLPVIRNLKNQRRREYKKECSLNNKKMICESTFCKSYMEGFLCGLNQKLQKAKKEIFLIAEESMKYELMVVKKDALLADFISEEVKPKQVNPAGLKNIDPSSFNKGLQDGKEENMNRKLN